jgi:hypothetical protein
MIYKFNGSRYLTRGIQSELPIELQIILWSMIDDNIKKGLELDYLQVFELKSVNISGMKMQEITHKQEQPLRTNTFAFETNNPISTKIFVIDDVSHITMLLSHEY